MKKLLFVLIAGALLSSCGSEPVLDRGEYIVVDTLYTSRNGFGMVLGYSVVIDIDSSRYYGELNQQGDLVRVNPRKLKK